MKRFVTFLVIILSLSLACNGTAYAGVLDEHEAFWCTFYSEAGTAYLADTSKDGYMLLSLAAGPDIAAELFDELDLFCSKVDFLNLSDYIPGCSYVDAGSKFYKYVSKNMTIKVLYSDPETNEEIWHGTLSDGSVMRLGNDHPGGYTISFMADGLSYPYVQLIPIDNVTWKDP